MKKALIPAILMLAMLAGCGEEEKVIEATTARPREQRIEEEPTPTEEPEEPIDPGVTADPEFEEAEYLPLTLETHYKTVYDEEEEYKTRYEGHYPELTLNSDEYSALKSTISKLNADLKDAVEQASEDYMEYAYEDSAFDDDWSYYYFRECDMTIDRADTKLVSLKLLWGDFAGGVHPNSYYETHVYDTESGKALELDDIIDTSKKDELLKLVGERALENNDALEDMLFDDIDKELAELDEQYSFTFSLDREGLTFYFSPYVLGAYAAGSTAVTIGYDEIPGLIKDEYKQLPSDYILAISDPSEVHTLSDGRTVSCSSEFDDEDGMTFTINLDGTEYNYSDFGYQSWFYLAEKNGSKFVLRETQHDNDYVDVTVYNISGSVPAEAGDAWASFDDGLFNPDCMQMRSRGELLSTYGLINNYELDEDGFIIPLDDEYMITVWKDEWILTFKQDLEVEARDSYDSDVTYTMQMKKGDEISFYATDNQTYVDFKTKNGNFVRIYVDWSDYPQSVNGIDIDELFDGIMFAG